MDKVSFPNKIRWTAGKEETQLPYVQVKHVSLNYNPFEGYSLFEVTFPLMMLN